MRVTVIGGRRRDGSARAFAVAALAVVIAGCGGTHDGKGTLRIDGSGPLITPCTQAGPAFQMIECLANRERLAPGDDAVTPPRGHERSRVYRLAPGAGADAPNDQVLRLFG